ncbi:GNAT family N-acetyltransferase [Conexibacter sp. SYSU D00693]|uniref:GNAT family N-acetyltransferase n=1 Tax=Conexibacter sp. SYSU D00693 TaxID=2812560 RepID=UPI00196AC898|nr:GNAT family N-acetyltransferase [Conexibacter sp. SYSU D00693]
MTARTWLAGPHEAEHVANLLIAFRNHFEEDWPSDNAMLAGVERVMEDRNADFLLGAPHDDAPPAAVAQLRYRFGIWRAGTECLLEDLFVREDARGTGLGRAMMEAVVARAHERGARLLELDTHEDNAPALALYASFGLTPERVPGGPRRLFLRGRLDEE